MRALGQVIVVMDGTTHRLLSGIPACMSRRRGSLNCHMCIKTANGMDNSHSAWDQLHCWLNNRPELSSDAVAGLLTSVMISLSI